jgi:hypothetical protein
MLSDCKIPVINICGGEPLLNKHLPDYMRELRKKFSKSKIQIITNGLLLASQSETFWDALKEYGVIIMPTKYPGIDWEKIEKLLHARGVEPEYCDFSGNTEKTSRKFCLDLSGSQDIKKAFNRCYMAMCAIALKNGRMATCSFVFNMRYFNKYFGQNIPVTDADSIDIYKAKNMQDIVDFLNKPIPLCAYCKSIGTEIVGPWRRSEKKIEEYT